MFQKIFSNTLSQILSKIGTALISIFLLSILTNYLTIELFWLYSKVYNYLGIFAFLADLGLYTIAIREITANKNDTEKIIGNILTLRGILWIIIIFLALSWAYFLPWYNSDIALTSIFVAWFFTFFSLCNSSILACMQAYTKIEFNLFSTIFGKLVNLWVIVWIALFLYPKTEWMDYHAPFLGIMVAWLVGILVNTWLNFWYASRLCKLRFLFEKKYVVHLIKITLPYAVALFLSMVYFKIDIILLSILEPKQIADTSVALYSLPMKIIEVLMILWGFYVNSTLPHLAENFQKNDIQKIHHILNNSFRFLYSFWLICVVLVTVLREHIVDVIANEEYINSSFAYSSVDVFPVVIGVAFFYYLSSIFNYILIASKNETQLLKINVGVTLINILGNILLIPYLSFMWAAITTLISQMILMVLWFLSTKKLVQYQVNYIYIIQWVIFSLVLYVVLNFWVQHLDFWSFWESLIVSGIWWTLYAIFFIFTNTSVKNFLTDTYTNRHSQ